MNRRLPEVINEALRAGLETLQQMEEGPRSFRTELRDLHLHRGLSVDNIGELLARVEGEDYR